MSSGRTSRSDETSIAIIERRCSSRVCVSRSRHTNLDAAIGRSRRYRRRPQVRQLVQRHRKAQAQSHAAASLRRGDVARQTGARPRHGRHRDVRLERDSNGFGSATAHRSDDGRRAARLSVCFLAAVALLFATAVANIAGMQLARSTSRRREVAIRSAIGASRGRSARQLLIENAIVGLAGGASRAWDSRSGSRQELPSLLPLSDCHAARRSLWIGGLSVSLLSCRSLRASRSDCCQRSSPAA